MAKANTKTTTFVPANADLRLSAVGPKVRNRRRTNADLVRLMQETRGKYLSDNTVAVPIELYDDFIDTVIKNEATSKAREVRTANANERWELIDSFRKKRRGRSWREAARLAAEASYPNANTAERKVLAESFRRTKKPKN